MVSDPPAKQLFSRFYAVFSSIPPHYLVSMRTSLIALAVAMLACGSISSTGGRFSRDAGGQAGNAATGGGPPSSRDASAGSTAGTDPLSDGGPEPVADSAPTFD